MEIGEAVVARQQQIATLTRNVDRRLGRFKATFPRQGKTEDLVLNTYRKPFCIWFDVPPLNRTVYGWNFPTMIPQWEKES
ncbi:hypothetical protein, partial [Rhizobium halophilum]|uniref:hypothetical protein n=1 Tax=Rhizobium halophilum TaxID=2846852 RepID=UPI001EFDBFFC